MSTFLPVSWTHNDDGTYTQSGGARGQYYQGTVDGVMGKPCTRRGQPNCGAKKNYTQAVFLEVVQHGILLQDASWQNGRKVVRICDKCGRRNVQSCYQMGDIDVCIGCANALLQQNQRVKNAQFFAAEE